MDLKTFGLTILGWENVFNWLAGFRRFPFVVILLVGMVELKLLFF